MAMSEFIVCSLADKKFALNFLEVEEVMIAKKGTPLPFSEAWHEGMVTIRDSVFTILNLRKKLFLPASTESSEDKMILLSRAKIALVVDQVEDTASAEDSRLQSNEEEWQRELFPTVLEHHGALIPVLDMNAFLASTKTS
jgi:purine-binding chemotaxis protein CheW